MKQDFTQEDLVRYLYKETSEKENSAIATELNKNWLLKNDYEKLASAKQELIKATFSPSETAIQAILRHSEEALEPHCR